MRYVVVLLGGCLLLQAASLRGQQAKRPRHRAVPAPPVIFTYVSQSAAFDGDPSQWVSARLRYPDYDHEAGISGRAYIRFLIDSTGAVQSVSVRRSSGSAHLDSEACRVIRSMPTWKPARVNGRHVRQRLVMPVSFQIEWPTSDGAH